MPSFEMSTSSSASLGPAPLAHAAPSAGRAWTSGALALAESAALEVAPASVLPGPVAAPLAPVVAKEEPEALTTWRALVARVRKASPPVAAMLDLAIPITVTREKLVVGVEDDSFEEFRVEQTDARTILTNEAHVHFGTKTEIVFERTARGSKVASVAYLDAAKRKQMQVEARARVEHHELVRQAVRVFDAELKDVKLPAQEE